jgi:hypothetical protein
MPYVAGQLWLAVLYAGIPIVVLGGAFYAQRRRGRPFSNAVWAVIGVGAIVLALVAGEVLGS